MIARWPIRSTPIPAAATMGAAVVAMGTVAMGTVASATAQAQPDGGTSTEPSELPSERNELPAKSRPQLQQKLKPTTGIKTGDPVTLTIRAVAKKGDDVAVPKQSFAPFEVLERNVRVQPNASDAAHGTTTFLFELKLLALDPGTHTVGPVKLRVVTKDGVVGFVSTHAREIKVGSLLANEPDAKPKPATKPVVVMQDDYTLAWVLGGIAAAFLGALLTLLLLRWWRKRARAQAPPPPPRPAWELALKELNRLEHERNAMFVDAQVPPDAEKVILWVDGVSDAVRAYLGRRYGFDGLESTTDEAIEHLQRAKVLGVTLPEIEMLLGDCDLVKFAQAPIDSEQAESLLASSFRVVRRTSPLSQEPAKPSSQGSTPMGSTSDSDASEPSSAEQLPSVNSRVPGAPSIGPGRSEELPASHPDAKWMPKPEPNRRSRSPSGEPNSESEREPGGNP